MWKSAPEACQKRLEADLERAKRFLASHAGVRRIWLFGSAAKGRRLDWRSDLDFAVEGLPAGELFGTWSRLDAMLSYPADLVRWEEANPALRTEILRWGRLLYAS